MFLDSEVHSVKMSVTKSSNLREKHSIRSIRIGSWLRPAKHGVMGSKNQQLGPHLIRFNAGVWRWPMLGR